MKLKSVLIFFLLLFLGSCEKPVPPGRILVLNTSLDKEFNTVSVSGGGMFKNLKPGDSVLLPKGTTSISFSRRYKDYTRNYQVQCPATQPTGIRIKLIDVHMNRIAGGCKTISGAKD